MSRLDSRFFFPSSQCFSIFMLMNLLEQERLEDCHDDMVSKVQGGCVLSETVLPGLCDFTYSVPNPVKPQSLDESFIRCHGWLGHLGDCEWRTEADHRVHRERNYDGAVFSSSDVDIRREDWKRLEEDTV